MNHPYLETPPNGILQTIYLNTKIIKTIPIKKTKFGVVQTQSIHQSYFPLQMIGVGINKYNIKFAKAFS